MGKKPNPDKTKDKSDYMKRDEDEDTRLYRVLPPCLP
jgi:hypothetical protein